MSKNRCKNTRVSTNKNVLTLYDEWDIKLKNYLILQLEYLISKEMFIMIIFSEKLAEENTWLKQEWIKVNDNKNLSVRNYVLETQRFTYESSNKQDVMARIIKDYIEIYVILDVDEFTLFEIMYELRYEHIYFKNKNYSNSLLGFKHMSSYSIGKVQITLVTQKKLLKIMINMDFQTFSSDIRFT